MGKAAHIALCYIWLLKAELILVQLITALPDRLKIERTLKAEAECNADVKHMHQTKKYWLVLAQLHAGTWYLQHPQIATSWEDCSEN